ncbi:hypothetical protein VP01_11591g1, partial [Puccinia sorghi]
GHPWLPPVRHAADCFLNFVKMCNISGFPGVFGCDDEEDAKSDAILAAMLQAHKDGAVRHHQPFGREETIYHHSCRGQRRLCEFKIQLIRVVVAVVFLNLCGFFRRVCFTQTIPHRQRMPFQWVRWKRRP